MNLRLGLAISLLFVVGCTLNPSGNLRETFQQTRADRIETTSLTELFEIGVQNDLGPKSEYRLSERLIRTDSILENEDDTLRDTRWLHQPSADLVLGLGALAWTQGFELQSNSTSPSIGANNTLVRRNLLEKLEWEPIDLPRVTAWFDLREVEDDLFIDTRDDEFVLQIEESRGAFDYLYTFESETISDRNADINRDRLDHLFRGTYRDEYFDRALTATANLFIEDRRLTIRTPGDGTGGLAGEILPRAALADVDITPAVGALTPNPALIDGDLDTPTNINIGGFPSGGTTDWNIGVEFLPDSTLTGVFLTTEEEVDDFFLPQFSFSVWTSDDNAFWQLATPALTYTYERGLRRFRILLPSISARFVKIINVATPPTAPAVLVTEIQTFGPPPDGAASDTDSFDIVDTTQNLTGNLFWNAVENLRFTYDVFAQRARRRSDDILRRDERRLDNGLTALWNPSDTVDVNLRATNQQINDSEVFDEDFWLFNGLVDYRPLETLDLALNYTNTRRDREDDNDFRTSAIQGRAAAQLLDTLQGEILLEQNSQDDLGNDRIIRRTILGAGIFAELSPRWRVSVQARDELATVTGSGSDEIPDPDERIIETILLYRPSDQLTAEAELEWRDTFAGDGVNQRYRLDWIPFPDGAIDIQLDASRQVSSLTNTNIDRFLALTRWTFSPWAFLEINYTAQIIEQGQRSTALSAGLNVQF